MSGPNRSDELREPGCLGLFAQLGDRHGVFQRPGQRLVDEHRFSRFENRPDLFEMRAPIDALQQHDINFVQQRRNRIDDFDAHPLDLLGEFRPAIAAGGNIAAGRKRRDDPHARQIGRGIGIIDELGEFADVRRIEPDDPRPQHRRHWRRLSAERSLRRNHHRSHDEHHLN